jgi:hypothetical protein
MVLLVGMLAGALKVLTAVDREVVEVGALASLHLALHFALFWL